MGVISQTLKLTILINGYAPMSMNIRGTPVYAMSKQIGLSNADGIW